MAHISASPPVFSVRHKDPQLVTPAKPVPYEEKLLLSDVDDQEALRYQISFIMFYGSNPISAPRGKDPVNIIRDALAEALVYYYPLAGRLREGPDMKLIVDCTGEGALFVEADADVTLAQLGDTIQPPCPYLDQLLYDVPGSSGLFGRPLLLIQVTRLLCGGFVFAIRWSHNVADALGMFKFLNTVAEMARGATKPSQPPLWQREILNARDPPSASGVHHEFDEVNDANSKMVVDMDIGNNKTIHKSFFFGSKQLSSIRKHLPPHLQSTSAFVVLAAFLWKCRTIAMEVDPEEIVRVSHMVSASGKGGIELPDGYYGNAFIFPVARSTARQLSESPLDYAVRLVKDITSRTNEEYIRSAIDLMVIKGKRQYRTVKDFVIADTTRLPFAMIDFGWGKGLYGGPAGVIQDVSFFARYKNVKGENGTVVQISLPQQVMERFQKELEKVMIGDSVNDQHGTKAIQCKL
ncbi:hypothetical protein Tsubulata_017325 [Turnera subulata]|uniref:Uncharacterized protein n=1 Tax=Turnera subulata TaxID=218843 RepID=A0A9Q0JD71_9ROSI|nr:hypothetical protein Tsubulata_017325 [Turnera subulata]